MNTQQIIISFSDETIRQFWGFVSLILFIFGMFMFVSGIFKR